MANCQIFGLVTVKYTPTTGPLSAILKLNSAIQYSTKTTERYRPYELAIT